MRRPHYVLFLALQVFKVLGVQQDVNKGDESSGNPPNILIMLADDLGWNDLSWHNPRVRLLLMVNDITSMFMFIDMLIMDVFSIKKDLKGVWTTPPC